MSSDITRLVARVADLERRLSRSTRTSSLAYSSIENGAVEVYDEDGSLRAVVGTQPDGTAGINVVNGPPPPEPAAPAVTSVLGGIAAVWDGTFAEGAVTPLDFARVEVHTGTAPEFTPGPHTLAATLESPQGGLVTVPTEQPVHVRLVARNTSGAASEPSASTGPVGPEPVVAEDVLDGSITEPKIAERAVNATHIKLGAVTVDHLAVGVTGNLIPDPSFETGYIASRIVGLPGVAVVTGGNSSGKALRFTLISSAPRTLLYSRFPVTAGERYWAAFDFKGGTDFVGRNGLLMSLQWLDTNGAHLSYSVISNAGPPADGVWRRGTFIHAAPAGAAYCVPGLQSPTGSGTVYFDNVELRPVMSSATGGTRAEIAPDGLRLYDAQGEESVSLVTGRPNYLTLSTDGRPVATIDQQGNGAFSDLSVAGELSVGGDPLERILARLPRGLVAVDYMATAVTAGSSEYGYIELAFEADTSRMYKITFDAYADPNVAGGEIAVVLRDGGAATPTISSPQIQSITQPLPGAGWTRVHLETIKSGGALGGGVRRLLVSFWAQGGPAGQTVRLLGAAPYLGIFAVEDIGPYVPETGVYNTGGGTVTPAKKSYTKIYNASWSGSYANRSQYNAYYNNQCLQGYYSSTNGMQSALIGFPASLATDLSGASIQRAELFLYYEHWYSNTGGTAVLKAHKHASRPASFSCDSEAMSVSWSRNQGKWVDITAIFDSTLWRGIALDPNNSSSAFYGRARGVGEAYAPQLKVTYVK
ncbi:MULTISPECIES: hypothetical protein [unclassified Streptomyces]|uniref:hypothetical protein n=1 Tax=unclassified Streptomyces TaxID=2593676 RepID=UPI0006B0515B|nr:MULTISPECIES: hypothetical protein [unclassified Streptomyces]KOX33034.1 hypothetical protein ADL06_09820 [Streptomyces sp. NRRL F-6491]KOX49534.1 hypothetical protein ADL08_08515 [Streptomyces sp. NRRL F-6492]